LKPKFFEFVEKEIQAACIDSYEDYGQSVFERYYLYADYWTRSEELRDADTGESYDKKTLNAELEKIEKPAGISNPKDFRQEIVNYGLRYKASNHGKLPNWRAYQKIAEVIEKRIVGNMEELLPVIAFNKQKTEESRLQHESYVSRMTQKGYTLKQIHLISDWYLRSKKAS
jgi:serine protein kinase